MLIFPHSPVSVISPLEPLQTVSNKVFLRPVMSNPMEDSLFCPVAPHLSPPQADSLSPLLSLCLSLSLPPFTWCFSENVLKSFFSLSPLLLLWVLQSVELKHTAVVLPAFSVPKGRAPVHDNKGEDEGARAGGRASRANILFTPPFAHAHTCTSAPLAKCWTKDTQKWAHCSTPSHTLWKNANSKKKTKELRGETDLNQVMNSVKQVGFCQQNLSPSFWGSLSCCHSSQLSKLRCPVVLWKRDSLITWPGTAKK